MSLLLYAHLVYIPGSCQGWKNWVSTYSKNRSIPCVLWSVFLLYLKLDHEIPCGLMSKTLGVINSKPLVFLIYLFYEFPVSGRFVLDSAALALALALALLKDNCFTALLKIQMS